MPNQRSTNKKQITAAFDKSLLDAIDAMAAKMGMTRTDFLKAAAQRELARMMNASPSNNGK